MHRGRRARRADADVLRSAATRLRDDPELARHMGLAGPEDAAALAALLDLLASELPHVDSTIRRSAVESCRRLRGEGRG
jgi:HEAT repeat protein